MRERSCLEIGVSQPVVPMKTPAAANGDKIQIMGSLKVRGARSEHHCLAAIDLMVAHQFSQHFIDASHAKFFSAQHGLKDTVQFMPIADGEEVITPGLRAKAQINVFPAKVLQELLQARINLSHSCFNQAFFVNAIGLLKFGQALSSQTDFEILGPSKPVVA